MLFTCLVSDLNNAIGLHTLYKAIVIALQVSIADIFLLATLLNLICRIRIITYMKTTIIVADEHEIVRSGIVSALSSGRDIEIVSETGDGKEVLYLYREHTPTLVIMDLSLPGMNGLEVTRELLREDPLAKVLFLTMQLNETLLVQAIRSGALGYMMKNAERTDLIEGVRNVSRGKTWFSQPVMRIMADYYVMQHKPENGLHQVIIDFGLTQREREILCMIAESMTSVDIGEKLFISQRTVETHRANIMQKLGIKNSAGLVRFAIENGIMGVPRA